MQVQQVPREQVSCLGIARFASPSAKERDSFEHREVMPAKLIADAVQRATECW
jgi:hypothetical protein